jgi:hypothetical protein
MSKKSSQRWDIRHPNSTSNFWTKGQGTSGTSLTGHTFLEASGALTDWTPRVGARLSSITRAPCRNVMGVPGRIIRQNENPARGRVRGRGLGNPRVRAVGRARAPLPQTHMRAKSSSRNVRHDQPVRHTRLEVPDHAGLVSWDCDRQRLARGRLSLKETQISLTWGSKMGVFSRSSRTPTDSDGHFCSPKQRSARNCFSQYLAPADWSNCRE